MPSHPTQTPGTYRVWRTDTPFACGRTPAAIFALMTVRSMRLKRIHARAPTPIGLKTNVARAAWPAPARGAVRSWRGAVGSGEPTVYAESAVHDLAVGELNVKRRRAIQRRETVGSHGRARR